VHPPRVQQTEIEIIREDEIRLVLNALRGRNLPLYTIATVALATGMRRGELLALRWKNIDLDAGRLRVEQSLEQTKAGLRFKAPKSKHGRRTITIPPAVVSDLRAHWKATQEQRLTLGIGRSTSTDLVFTMWDGAPRNPNALTNGQEKRIGRRTSGSFIIFAAIRPLVARELARADRRPSSIAIGCAPAWSPAGASICTRSATPMRQA